MNKSNRPIIVKIGGSILTDRHAYGRAAKFVRDRLQASDERYVVVVSAQNGTTNALARTARRILPTPPRRAQDLLWATGELRSVAILVMHLNLLSVSAVGLNVHETGLMMPHSGGSCSAITVNSEALEKELDHHQVLVVPGFLGTNNAGSIVSLGRGGSDLTAVLLAIRLDALRCELVKGVGGYFTADPHVDRTARHIRFLTYERALEMAEDGCELVQREAIEIASDSSFPLLIRSMDESHRASVISSRSSERDPMVAATRELTVRD